MTREQLNQLLAGGNAQEIMAALMAKCLPVPYWSALVKEYDPNQHRVMTDLGYEQGFREATGLNPIKITLDFQRLAVKRMTELCFGIPVKRVYKDLGGKGSNTEKMQRAKSLLERIFIRNHIDSLNIERGRMLFAGCEVFTLWYGVEQRNSYYGIDSPIKIRCRNYSPMQGDALYPVFDDYGDMLAMCFYYTRKSDSRTQISVFEVFTDTQHYRISYSKDMSSAQLEYEDIAILKIPGVYLWRTKPIWEDSSNLVTEMEWTLSRNGNYIRKNSRPTVVVKGNGKVVYDTAPQDADSDIVQIGEKMEMSYMTWNQSIESVKFHIEQLRQAYFAQLQLPDFSFENMKSTPMSGEARKMMFIDAQLKVRDESGRIIEGLDREVNVVKAFAKQIAPDLAAEIDDVVVENIITPFTINDDKETITNLMTATGGKPILSQREGVGYLGWSDNVDGTLEQLEKEAMSDATELAL